MSTATTPAPAAFRSHVQRILDKALEQPDRVLVQDAHRRLSGRQFDHLVRDLAGQLAAQGVESGSVVALAAPITIETVAARYAASWLGCATAVCPNAMSPDRLADFVGIVGADLLICFPTTRASAEAVLARGVVPAIIGIDDFTDRQLVGHPDEDDLAVEGHSVAADQLGALISSGGTTGSSKASYRSFAQWLSTVAAGSNPTRRQLICCSLAYVSQVHLDQTLLSGGTVILLDHFDPEVVLRTIEAEKITHLCLVEPLLAELADHPDVERRDLSTLVALSHIGANAAPSLRRHWLARLGPRLVHPYGASEAGIISVLDPTHYRLTEPDRLDTSGRALDTVEVRIERDDGSPAQSGEEGLIVVRSSGVASGYVGGADESAFRPQGWYVTGDLGHLDGDGYLHVRGRAKDQRTVDGLAVLPLDVQEALTSHPDVRYAVALPGAAPEDGFDALVLLQPASRLTVAALRTYVRTTFGSHLVPRLLAVGDRVPVTEQGKPDRGEIRRTLGTR